MNKFITTEDITKVQTALNDLTAGKRKIKLAQYKFREPSEAVRIGEIRTVVYNSNCVYLQLSEAVGASYSNRWHRDVGGVFVKAVKKHTKNIYELVTPTFKALLVKILEEELDAIALEGLDHVKMGDYIYTIIRVVCPEETYYSEDLRLPKEECDRTGLDEDDDYEYVEDPEEEPLSSLELF